MAAGASAASRAWRDEHGGGSLDLRGPLRRIDRGHGAGDSERCGGEQPRTRSGGQLAESIREHRIGHAVLELGERRGVERERCFVDVRGRREIDRPRGSARREHVGERAAEHDRIVERAAVADARGIDLEPRRTRATGRWRGARRIEDARHQLAARRRSHEVERADPERIEPERGGRQLAAVGCEVADADLVRRRGAEQRGAPGLERRFGCGPRRGGPPHRARVGGHQREHAMRQADAADRNVDDAELGRRWCTLRECVEHTARATGVALRQLMHALGNEQIADRVEHVVELGEDRAEGQRRSRAGGRQTALSPRRRRRRPRELRERVAVDRHAIREPRPRRGGELAQRQQERPERRRRRGEHGALDPTAERLAQRVSGPHGVEDLACGPHARRPEVDRERRRRIRRVREEAAAQHRRGRRVRERRRMDVAARIHGGKQRPLRVLARRRRDRRADRGAHQVLDDTVRTDVQATAARQRTETLPGNAGEPRVEAMRADIERLAR
ncbi:MAG TPA: hypothetical protein VN253_26615 [Kofleriaceae bacterium]|nr:hypothetical protein [Kofleriaceae bacterium]